MLDLTESDGGPAVSANEIFFYALVALIIINMISMFALITVVYRLKLIAGLVVHVQSQILHLQSYAERNDETLRIIKSRISDR